MHLNKVNPKTNKIFQRVAKYFKEFLTGFKVLRGDLTVVRGLQQCNNVSHSFLRQEIDLSVLIMNKDVTDMTIFIDRTRGLNASTL